MFFLPEHYRTFSNNFEHFLYFQRTLEDVKLGQVGATATQTRRGEAARKKMYKCRIPGCDHTPFINKHSLVTHLMVTHKKEGSKCQICGKVMSKYHMSGHLDHHSLSKRFQCKEKFPGGAVCERSYKQKSALVRHLKEKHQKSLQSARVHI